MWSLPRSLNVCPASTARGGQRAKRNNCLEVLVLRGQAETMKKMADEFIAAKGSKTANSP